MGDLMMWHGRTACALAPGFEGASVLLRAELPWPFIFSRNRMDPYVTRAFLLVFAPHLWFFRLHVSTVFVVGSTRDPQHKCPVANFVGKATHSPGAHQRSGVRLCPLR